MAGNADTFEVRCRLAVLQFLHSPRQQRRTMRGPLAAMLAQLAERDPDLTVHLVALMRVAANRQVWRKVARAEQLAPGTPGAKLELADWFVWLVLAGRGFGKTRTGAEETAERLKRPNQRVALVAATFAAGRDDMVEGESGLIRCLPPSLLIKGAVSKSWNRSMGELTLANGSEAKIYTSEKPDQLRGPQHHFAWADELCKFRDRHLPITVESTWQNLAMGMRLGRKPQIVATTTPKNVALLVGTRDDPNNTGLLHHKRTVLTHGTTYDNLDNLADTFRDVIMGWEGTRIGRQELLAEILTEVDGALWTSALLEALRVAPGYEVGTAGGLVRIVVGVDPSVGAGIEGQDECGIVVVGLGADGHAYVLADYSLLASPAQWAEVVVLAYDRHQADAIVAEKNNGGELVTRNVRVVDPRVNIKTVSAAHGKLTRAEPVAALYERELVHHVGLFPLLVDQLTGWVPMESNSPDRLDALVWAITELFHLDEKAGVTSVGQARRQSRRRR